MKVNFYFHDYNFFPYELTLAKEELISLFNKNPIKINDGFSIENPNEWLKKSLYLTYFKEVKSDKDERIIPIQTFLESSANGYNGKINNNTKIPTIKRQFTRYSAHGLHEYKGKFNPQIVRTIGNIIKLQPKQWLLDPFCGSGTTLLESAHVGWNAVGIDINPLSIMISQSKIKAIHTSEEQIQRESEAILENLLNVSKNLNFNTEFTNSTINFLLDNDNIDELIPSYEYLIKWFRKSVLAQIIYILKIIDNKSSINTSIIFKTILSNILREVSLQDPGDLRIRRRSNPPDNEPVIIKYMEELNNKIEPILNLKRTYDIPQSFQNAILGDSKQLSKLMSTQETAIPDNFNGAITSPPYATALPYIDTNRLSLVLFGLISSNEIRSTEKKLIGNREINNKERLKIEEELNSNKNNLPDYSYEFCMELKNAVDYEKDGFRRQNKPALIYKYLSDMKLVLEETFKILNNDAKFALVIGNNRTKLGGKRYTINNPKLLLDLGKNIGYNVYRIYDLDTYQRFELHKANSIRSEKLIIFSTGKC